ncbi:unnamed protein product [Scytosiphon promiscuus]
MTSAPLATSWLFTRCKTRNASELRRNREWCEKARQETERTNRAGTLERRDAAQRNLTAAETGTTAWGRSARLVAAELQRH